MVLPALSSKKRFNRIISILLINTFLLSNVAYGATPQNNTSADNPKQQEINLDPNKVVVQRDYGLIKSRYIGKDKKLVIHIQDAHCNFEAQTNITKILEGLVKNNGLGLISVEGADGFIDTTWFKAFPDEEVRKEVATYFMKKGEITGPEFLSITTDYPIKLFGAETRSYYIQNLNAFTSSYPLKEDTEKYYNQIKTILNKLKNYIYSDELKALDAKSQDYEAKKLQFTDYVKFLESMAEKHQIKLRGYENLFKLVSVLVYEKKIDFNMVDKERTQAIDTLTKKLEKSALTELVNQSLSFKVGKISSAEYYSYLKGLAGKYGISLVNDYPNLFNYIIYNSVYSRIENEKLFKDIKDLERAIKEKVFANDEQRTLDKLSYHIEILLGLVNIKLLNGDFDYYKAHKEEFSHETFASFIKQMSERYGFAYELDAPCQAVTESMPKLEDFYEIAIKRDKALVDNTLQAMRQEGTQICVLVTGGFHSEGITRLLEHEGISYIVVCPNITKEVETPYIKILTNQRTPLEEILSDNSAATADTKNVKNGMLAPASIAWLTKFRRDDLAKFYEEVYKKNFVSDKEDSLFKNISGLKKRADYDEEEWTRLSIEGWLERALANISIHRLSADWDEETMKVAYSMALTNRVLELVSNRNEGMQIAKDIIDSGVFKQAFTEAYDNVTKRQYFRTNLQNLPPALERKILDILVQWDKDKTKDAAALEAALRKAGVNDEGLLKNIIFVVQSGTMPGNPAAPAKSFEIAETLSAPENECKEVFQKFSTTENIYLGNLNGCHIESGESEITVLFDEKVWGFQGQAKLKQDKSQPKKLYLHFEAIISNPFSKSKEDRYLPSPYGIWQMISILRDRMAYYPGLKEAIDALSNDSLIANKGLNPRIKMFPDAIKTEGLRFIPYNSPEIKAALRYLEKGYKDKATSLGFDVKLGKVFVRPDTHAACFGANLYGIPSTIELPDIPKPDGLPEQYASAAVIRCAELIGLMRGDKDKFLEQSRTRPEHPMVLTVLLPDWDDDNHCGSLLATPLGFRLACDEALAKYGKDLNYLYQNGLVTIGGFSDAGTGKRCSPVSQAYGDSRGSMNLVGTLNTPSGQQLDLSLLLATAIQTSRFAGANLGKTIDVHYVSQIAVEATQAREDKEGPLGPETQKNIEAGKREDARCRAISNPLSFKAAIFDLDGIVTKTALVHRAAWKVAFDEFLQTIRTNLEQERGNVSGYEEAFREFTTEDYLTYVDGKPRYNGVASFLESRGFIISDSSGNYKSIIETLPATKQAEINELRTRLNYTIEWGIGDQEPAGMLTVTGVGNKKNAKFVEIVSTKGVEPYYSTVNLIRRLRSLGVRIGVASSSKNCASVLESAGLTELFGTRVDGLVSAELGLKGKPASDIFVTAAKWLGVDPREAIVFEDADSGVKAGHDGGFGLVVGVARAGNKQSLLDNRADIVVSDLMLVGIEDLEKVFTDKLGPEAKRNIATGKAEDARCRAITNPLNFEGAIFDVDGVVTKTAVVHRESWRLAFNERLEKLRGQLIEERGSVAGYEEAFREFTLDDYLKFVDGRPRYNGVACFLESRGFNIVNAPATYPPLEKSIEDKIAQASKASNSDEVERLTSMVSAIRALKFRVNKNIEWGIGDDSEPVDNFTVSGIGNRKNEQFREVLRRDGVEAYESTVSLIRELRALGVRVAAASSSKSAREVLEAAGIADLFGAIVEGRLSTEWRLSGKPNPDIFVTAASLVCARPEKSMVFEDAESGVAAGRNGGFGLVIGLAREHNQDALKANGADFVVEDIAETSVKGLSQAFAAKANAGVLGASVGNYEQLKENYRGYDVLMISVTDKRQKEIQEEVFEKAFGHFKVSQIAALNPNTPEGRLASRFFSKYVVIAKGKDLINENLRDLGIYVIDHDNHNVVANYPKGTLIAVDTNNNATREIRVKATGELLAAFDLKQGTRVSGYELTYSYGSHRLSKEYLLALEKYWGARMDDRKVLGKKRPVLEAPDIAQPVILKLSGMDVEAIATAVKQPKTPEDKSKAVASMSDILGFSEATGVANGWMGAHGISEDDIFWWRYRRPLDILNTQLAMIAELAGRKVEIEPAGTSKDLGLPRGAIEEARAMLAFRGIKAPVANSDLGNVHIDENGIRSDNGLPLTFENIREGLNIGGVYIKGSLVQNSKIKTGSSIVESIVNNTAGNVKAVQSFVNDSLVSTLSCERALVMRVIDIRPINVVGQCVVDAFSNNIKDQIILSGQTRMWSRFDVDGRAANDTILPGNKYSFKELFDIMIIPTHEDTTRDRTAAKWYEHEGIAVVKKQPVKTEETMTAAQITENSIRPDAENYKHTLNMVSLSGKLPEGVVDIVVYDTRVGGDTETVHVAQEAGALAEQYLGKAIVNIRGTGKAVAEEVRLKISMLTEAGIKVRSVVTIAGNKTMAECEKDPKDLEILGKILNVQNNGNFVPVGALYELAILLAYDIKNTDTGRQRIEDCLKRIGIVVDANGNPLDPLAVISEKIIRILPKLKPVDTEENVKAQKAAQAVIHSL